MDNQQKQQKKNEIGFTLIEVLVALIIFSVGILGIGMMQISSVRGNSVANEVSEATVFGSDQIERIMSWNYSDSRLVASNNNSSYLFQGKTIVADGHRLDSTGIYSAYWIVNDNVPMSDSKTIDVVVLWKAKEFQKALRFSVIKSM
jgi:prepilin-type N-terminal cleavage/methylation domain-containing protein